MDANATVPGGASPAYIFQVWNLVIRPPRSTYCPSQLGPTEFEDRRRELQKWPVIIYLHGNASSRLEASSLVGAVIAERISLFCFDAAGCGLSDGEYISLGWHERDDLATVIEHLRKSPFCGPIGVWGRSMGAVTALLHADRDPSLGAMCLDSPFASLRQLAEELVQSERLMFPVPAWMVSAALSVIRARVKVLANFDIEDLVPVRHAEKSTVPALFLHGKEDSFIQPHHGQQLFDAYAGRKEMLTIDGDHNTQRSPWVIEHVIEFFRRSLKLREIDLTLPYNILDQEVTAPQDGRPQRVPTLPQPLGRGNKEDDQTHLKNVFSKTGLEETSGPQPVPPPIARVPRPSLQAPSLRSSLGYKSAAPSSKSTKETAVARDAALAKEKTGVESLLSGAIRSSSTCSTSSGSLPPTPTSSSGTTPTPTSAGGLPSRTMKSAACGGA